MYGPPRWDCRRRAAAVYCYDCRFHYRARHYSLRRPAAVAGWLVPGLTELRTIRVPYWKDSWYIYGNYKTAVMENHDIDALVRAQKNYFATGRTRDLGFRLDRLHALGDAIVKYERDICRALWLDLHKSEQESYLTELALVYGEIRYHTRNLKRWARPARVLPTMTTMFASCRVLHEPLGVSLIISPFNYPVQLLLNPLVGAISAGCCAVLKTSREVPHVSAVLAELIGETFERDYIAVVEGGDGVNEGLMAERFDFIFFTGSPAAGKSIMRAAAENLTPVLLELGGKSPCIVDRDADLPTAARRIAWGKTINAGQTCIAPDYLFVHTEVKDRLIEGIIAAWEEWYGKESAESPYYPRIVNRSAVDRLAGLLDEGRVLYGGRVDREDKFVSPTIIDGVDGGSKIMQQEIFGPILPVMEFTDPEEVIRYVDSNEKPLALYYFGKCRRDLFFGRTSSGGGCIDDTVMHIANHRLPFGGVGYSGMGKYHGRDSFLAFSNRRAVVRSPRWFDMTVKYPPYRHFDTMKKFM